MYYCCGLTDTGCVRENNEDAYLINKVMVNDAKTESSLQAPFIVAVADGVGGESDGEIASRMALELLSDVRPREKTDYHKKIMNIHNKIKRYGMTHKRSENMQTTLCAFVVDNKGGHYILNVGDSRLYRMRGGKIRQLSTDQSLVQMLYANGSITAEERIGHSHKNVIMPVLGNMGSDPEPQITETESMEYGDIILICSDGLSDYLTKSEFEDILSLPLSLPKRLSRLTETAKKNGSSDNITVIAVSNFAD